MDENKAKVYETIGNLIMKFMFSIAAIVAFFIVLGYLINAETQFDAIKFGAIETVLAGSVFLAFKHFFPTNEK